MLSRRIKYAMDHLSHKQYTDLLAQPNWRRIRRINVNILSNPFTTRRSALKARASKRIKVMARPKYITKKYDPEKAPPPFPRIHPKILAATSSRRINDLALPTKRLLLSNLVFQTSGNIVEMLWKAQNSRYIRYRYFCNARQQREAKRKQKIMARLRKAIKPDDWDRHVEILKKLATPKVPPKPKFFVRQKKKMAASERATARRIIDTSRQRIAGCQGSVYGIAGRSHLQDHDTSPENCIPKDCTGNYTPSNPRHSFSSSVEGHRFPEDNNVVETGRTASWDGNTPQRGCFHGLAESAKSQMHQEAKTFG